MRRNNVNTLRILPIEFLIFAELHTWDFVTVLKTSNEILCSLCGAPALGMCKHLIFTYSMSSFHSKRLILLVENIYSSDVTWEHCSISTSKYI